MTNRGKPSRLTDASGMRRASTWTATFILLKGGLTGVYHGVSAEHLQAYVDEYVFRYNHRESERGMVSAFLGRVAKQSPSPA
jgi:hypothetical protein